MAAKDRVLAFSFTASGLMNGVDFLTHFTTFPELGSEPRKEKSHLPNTYYCAADDLAAVIPPPASSWHQASPYSLHQQAIPHKRKATDLADSTREKGIHSNCSHSYVDTKRNKPWSLPLYPFLFHNHKGRKCLAY